jgi:ferric-dicitrate binding protein FerR (iron transport regulator)
MRCAGHQSYTCDIVVEPLTDLDWQLFDRYLAGEVTSNERERFERWLAERPARAAQAAAFRQAIDVATMEVGTDEREAMWAGIVGGPAEAGVRRPVSAFSLEPSAGAPPRRRMAVALAAAVVLAAGAALAGRAWLKGSGRTEMPVWRAVAVRRAQQAEFRLPDGTAVVLAGGSTLRYPASFAGQSRTVELEGEATFRVEHNDRWPFRVRAGDLVATDLGTEFLVRAYPEDGRARVVVRSGTVAVAPAGAPEAARGERLIRPGEQGRLDSTGAPVVEPADTAAYFAWTRGTLVFDGMPLREALPQLSRWYDLEFRLADSALGVIPLSGTLDRTSTDERLELLAASLGLRQMRSGRVVTLSR